MPIRPAEEDMDEEKRTPDPFSVPNEISQVSAYSKDFATRLVEIQMKENTSNSIAKRTEDATLSFSWVKEFSQARLLIREGLW